MKFLIASTLFILYSVNLSAQADYGNKAEAIELCKVMQGNQFTDYSEVNSAIEDILSVIGAKNRFVVQPCYNIKNAIAVTMQGIRYIFFDPDFMNSITYGNYSSNLFILAHEVGHHINGHSQDIVMLISEYSPTPSTLYEQRMEELEADEFAGFILGKLGYTLASMQNTLRGIAKDGDDSYSTHPSLTKRLEAVEVGYNKAKGNDVLKTKVSSSRQTAEEYFYRAYDMAKLGDLHGAIKYYDKAIQLDPNEAITYFNRGLSKRFLEDYEGALQDFNEAIILNPNFEKTYLARGIVKHLLGNYEGAIQDLNKAIEINPNDADPYISRGLVKSHLGDQGSAILDFAKAIQIDPNDAKAYFWRGFAKSELGDQVSAIQDFSKAIQINPNYTKAYFKRGFSLGLLDDHGGAIQDFSKAIEINPNDAEVYYKRGCSKGILFDYKGAVQDFSKAIEINPNDAEAYSMRGVSKVYLGEKDSGCLDLSRSGELGNEKAYDLIREYCQ